MRSLLQKSQYLTAAKTMVIVLMSFFYLPNNSLQDLIPYFKSQARYE